MDQNPNGAQAPQQPTQPAAPQPMTTPPAVAQSIVNNIPSPEQAQQMQQPRPVLEVKFEDDLVLTVTPEVVNDMRFLELYEEVAESEFKIPKLLKFMFGEKQYNGIYEYYESRGQKFTITKMGEVFQKLDSDLNSNPDFLRQ